MSAAGLPVCLTRPPKLVLHPPPVSKSEIKSIPGVSNTSRKTTKKQAKKGISLLVKRSPGGEITDLAPGLALSPPLRVVPLPSVPRFLHLLNGLTNPHSQDYTKVDRLGFDGDPLRNREIQGNNVDT